MAWDQAFFDPIRATLNAMKTADDSASRSIIMPLPPATRDNYPLPVQLPGTFKIQAKPLQILRDCVPSERISALSAGM